MPDPLKYFWFLIVERLLILLLCCGARGEGSAPMFSDCRFWSDPGHHVKYLKQKMVSHREHILIIYCYVILGKPKSIDIVIFFPICRKARDIRRRFGTGGMSGLASAWSADNVNQRSWSLLFLVTSSPTLSAWTSERWVSSSVRDKVTTLLTLITITTRMMRTA